MHWIDWLIVCIPLLIVLYIGYKAQRHVQSVSDFLAAGRVAGRYVVAVAAGEASMGLVSIVALFQTYYASGFGIGYWKHFVVPIYLLITLSGFAIYRFRETRAMTMAQFLEVRYSKGFRIYAGFLMALSGIINYGIFPAVGARFVIYFVGLPMQLDVFGWFHIPMIAVVMAFFLSIALAIVFVGGHLTGMVTDCVQGILSYPLYTVVVVSLLVTFGWGHMSESLLDRPPGQSMLNPFDTGELKDFNPFYVIVGVIGNIYGMLSWQGTQAYNAAAASPHEQKMGRILGTWRGGFVMLMKILIAVTVFTYMHHAVFRDAATATSQRLDRMVMADTALFAAERGVLLDDQLVQRARQTGVAKWPLGDPAGMVGGIAEAELHEAVTRPTPGELIPDQATEPGLVGTAAAGLTSSEQEVIQTFEATRGQMILPVAMVDILPVGVTGAFLAVMIFLLISTDTTYLHSWGSIVVQDVILPWKKRPFRPRTQMWLLRGAIFGVALFGFLFSLLFAQTTYLVFFLQLTGAIWLGGAGAVILGGLYWKRGTTAAAWCTLIVGSVVSLGTFFAEKFWVGYIYPFLADSTPGFLAWLSNALDAITRWAYIDSMNWQVVKWKITPDQYPINGQEMLFIDIVLCLTIYTVVSLLTCREPFNMDRMLHRGKYRKEVSESERHRKPNARPRSTIANFIQRAIGIDEQFTLGDKVLSWSVFTWSFGYGFLIYAVALVWNLIDPWPDEWWANFFFYVTIVMSVAYGVVTTVWFFIGGTWDLRRLFKRLETLERNLADDGRVIGHVNAEDLAVIKEVLDEETVEQILKQRAAETDAYDESGTERPPENRPRPTQDGE